MSISNYCSSETTSESDENCVDIDTRYVRKQCIHDSCDKPVNADLQKMESEGVVEEEYIDLEEEKHECSLDGSFGGSNFTDAECGEPMRSQFLRLDFTPVEGIDDNPHILKKCNDFWEFLYSQPELQGLVVLPDKGYEEVISPSSTEISLNKFVNISTPAADWLETGVGQKMALAAKHQIKYCPQNNGDYKEETKIKKSSPSSETIRPETRNERRPLQPSVPSRFPQPAGDNRVISTSARDLCSQLEKWDRMHSKSMDPPGRVPNLTHAILQRKKQER